MPQNQDLFQKDTWLILDQLRAYNPADIIKYHFDQKLIPKGKLKENNMRALLNCIRKLQDIEERHLDNIL